ncbi:translation initiation factor IF-2-like [Pollicipes pollicipes]|uniref:translation initiation factor IF-2-like n=1 Tax=Pollicipes pollicipes TaxID=41117 RepID=UPI0018855F5A|nr:translation initiation factor IF-2-like [Pollicipes pollicipes]
MATLGAVSLLVLCAFAASQKAADFSPPFKVLDDIIVDSESLFVRDLTPAELSSGVVDLENPFGEGGAPVAADSTLTAGQQLQSEESEQLPSRRPASGRRQPAVVGRRASPVRRGGEAPLGAPKRRVVKVRSRVARRRGPPSAAAASSPETAAPAEDAAVPQVAAEADASSAAAAVAVPAEEATAPEAAAEADFASTAGDRPSSASVRKRVRVVSRKGGRRLTNPAVTALADFTSAPAVRARPQAPPTAPTTTPASRPIQRLPVRKLVAAPVGRLSAARARSGSQPTVLTTEPTVVATIPPPVRRGPGRNIVRASARGRIPSPPGIAAPADVSGPRRRLPGLSAIRIPLATLPTTTSTTATEEPAATATTEEPAAPTEAPPATTTEELEVTGAESATEAVVPEAPAAPPPARGSRRRQPVRASPAAGSPKASSGDRQASRQPVASRQRGAVSTEPAPAPPPPSPARQPARRPIAAEAELGVNEIGSQQRGLPGGSQSVIGDRSPSTFSCQDRPYGYYADMEADCQVFHICSPMTRNDGTQVNLKHSFFCNNGTLFDQLTLSCREETAALPCSLAIEYYNKVKYFKEYNYFDQLRAEHARREEIAARRLGGRARVDALERDLAELAADLA